jgi:acetyl esterase/lipase
VGGHETLLDDSHILATALRRAGVEVKIDVYPEMQHVFHFLAGTAPEADEAIGQLAAWVRPKLGLG